MLTMLILQHWRNTVGADGPVNVTPACDQRLALGLLDRYKGPESDKSPAPTYVSMCLRLQEATGDSNVFLLLTTKPFVFFLPLTAIALTFLSPTDQQLGV